MFTRSAALVLDENLYMRVVAKKYRYVNKINKCKIRAVVLNMTRIP